MNTWPTSDMPLFETCQPSKLMWRLSGRCIPKSFPHVVETPAGWRRSAKLRQNISEIMPRYLTRLIYSHQTGKKKMKFTKLPLFPTNSVQLIFPDTQYVLIISPKYPMIPPAWLVKFQCLMVTPTIFPFYHHDISSLDHYFHLKSSWLVGLLGCNPINMLVWFNIVMENPGL